MSPRETLASALAAFVLVALVSWGAHTAAGGRGISSSLQGRGEGMSGAAAAASGAAGGGGFVQHVEDRGHGGARKVWFSRPGGSPLQYEEVISLWRESEGFREEYISALRNAPFAAFFWETPPITLESASTTPFAGAAARRPREICPRAADMEVMEKAMMDAPAHGDYRNASVQEELDLALRSMAAQPPKRVKMSSIAPPAARSLLKAPIQMSGSPTPASKFGCRVAIRTPEAGGSMFESYVANGDEVLHFQMPRDPGRPFSLPGKEGLVTPTECSGSTTALAHLPHRGEVMSLTLHEMDSGEGGGGGEGHILGSVDSYGRAMVAHLGQGGRPPEAGGTTYALPTRRRDATQSGWAGVAFHPGQPTMSAVASYYGKSLELFDGEMLVRTFHTAQSPTAVKFLPQGGACGGVGRMGGPGGATMLLTEANQVSMWDHRAGERGGCVNRVISGWSGGHLYALDVAQGAGALSGYSGLVGCVGADRCVAIYDPRKWTVRGRWTGALKYEAYTFNFSTTDPRCCFVSGADYEVLCGVWEAEGGKGGAGRVEKSLSFRGDEGWYGVARAPRSDHVGGWCSSGNMFFADVGV